MTDVVSPPFRKALALGLLLFAVWLAANFAYLLVSRRMGLEVQLTELRQRYDDLRQRRVEIRTLQDQLAGVTSSAGKLVIIADSERAAVVRLQQAARKTVNEVQGRLVSQLDVGSDGTSSMVGTQLRVQVDESSLPQWLHLVEYGEPRIRIDELTIASRPPSVGAPSQLEISTILRARWLAEGAAK